MKKGLAVALITYSLSGAAEQKAASDPIRLVCTYSYSYSFADDTGGAVTGSDSVIVHQIAPNLAWIEVTGEIARATYTGTLSDAEIYGETEFTAQSSKVKQTIRINRYTGKFTKLFVVDGKGVLQSGECAVVQGRRF